MLGAKRVDELSPWACRRATAIMAPALC